MNNTIGLFIPNSDYSFEIRKIRLIKEHLIIITKKEEVIVYKIEDNKFTKKYILFTSCLNRNEIFDLLIMNFNEQDLLVMNNNISIVVEK
jgi:hypothetical protein